MSHRKSLRRGVLLAAALPFVAAMAMAESNKLHCADDARERAAKLLALHAETSNGAVAREVRALPSIRNPADAKQRFSVLAVDGYVYKATYRMRFIYAPISDTCVLMGQEILEFARP